MEIPKYHIDKLLSLDRLPAEKRAEIENNPEFLRIKSKIRKKMKGMPVPETFFRELLGRITALLHIDLRSILLGAWANIEALSQYLDIEKYPPAETVVVPLADHQLTSEHSPSLQPFLNEISLGKIPVRLLLDLSLQGVILTIRDRSIKAVSLAACRGDCRISVAGQPLLDLKKADFLQNEDIVLGDGIPIGDLQKDGRAAIEQLLGSQPELPTRQAGQPVH